MIQQVGFSLWERPRASCKQRNALSDREIYALNIRSLNQAAKALVFQKIVERLAFAPQHARDGIGELASFMALDQLPLKEPYIHLPVLFAGTRGTEPTTEVSGNRIEIRAQTIDGERRNTVGV